MSQKTLSARGVAALKPDPARRREVPDGIISGLYLVVQPSGAKSWALRYRHHGRPRKLTLGKYPGLGLAEARDEARRRLVEVSKGDDPAEDKRAGRLRRDDEIEAVVDLFIERYARPKNRSWPETQRIFDRYVLPAWRGRRISEIQRRDVIALLDRLVDRGTPFMANRVLAAVRKLFNWCLDRDLIDVSPVRGVKAPTPEVTRDRVLTDDEIVAVWRACDELGYPFGPNFRLLLLTGQRRDEVANMRWDLIDRDRRSWAIPREMSKNDRAQEVPLAPAALDILDALPRFEGSDYVFPAQRGGKGAIQGFSKAKLRLDGLSGVTGWRLHDLRRTAASGMARLNVPPHVVEKVLNHSSGVISGVAAVYNRHGYESEKRQALEAWARHVEHLVGPFGDQED
jgi:integrase